MKRPLDTTLGSTLPDPRAEEGVGEPALPTFERPDERFELGAELGRGGMGRVLAATDVSLARPVAIKQILSTHPDDLIRFEREVRITAQLEHPSIVPIHEAARDAEGRPYYVMRRIEGDPLATRLDGVDLAGRLALLPNLLAVVDAAAFAHARNIIHRDIKPSNILLGAYGETHLIDWGLARRLDDLDVSGARAPTSSELTQAGQVYGTVGYMAPEQARGEAVDKRADVYALGATLFHVLAGKAPFAHMSAAERLSAAVTGDDDPPLDRLGADIPPELVAIVEKAMARDAERRYPHAGALAADLRAFLAGQLVGAHRYTTGERIRRFVRKHRFAVGLSVTSVVLVVAITVAAFTQVMRDKATAEYALGRADQEAAERLAREDLLQIERASSLATADPDRAAAVLLEVRPATPHRAHARDTIARIAAAGLGQLVKQHDKRLNGLAFSANGKWLASVGEAGKVALLDVEAGTAPPSIDLGVPLYSVGWLDERTLLVTGDGLVGGRAIDLGSRAVRPFAEHSSPDVWWRAGTLIRYLDQTQHVVFEIAETGGSERVVARDIMWVEGRGQRAVLAGPQGVWLLDGARVREAIKSDRPIGAVALSADGEHFAYATADEVIECEFATNRPSSRWAVRAFTTLVYDGRSIVVLQYPNLLGVLTPGGGISNSLPLRALPMWNARMASGLVFGFADGDLVIYDHAGFHHLDIPRPGTRTLAALPDRMRIAVGSIEGSVRLLDLDLVTPNPLSNLPVSTSPALTAVCDTSNDRSWLFGDEGLYELDLSTRTVKLAIAGVGSLAPWCTSKFGSRIVAGSPRQASLLELDTGQATGLGAVSVVAVDQDRAVYARANDVFELLPGRPPTQIHHADAPIASLVMLDRWILMLQVDGRLRRFDRQHPQAPLADVTTTGSGVVGLFSDGRVWFAANRMLSIWDGNRPARVWEFDRPIASCHRLGETYFVVLSDGSLWAKSPGQRPEVRLPAGDRKYAFGPSRTVVIKEETTIVTYFLDTGDSIARDLPSRDVVVTFDEASLLVNYRNALVHFRDPVPQTYEAARAWLHDMTTTLPRPGVSASP